MLPFKPMAAMFDRSADRFPNQRLGLMVEGECATD